MTDKERQLIEDRKKVSNKSKIFVMAIILVMTFVTSVGVSVAWMAISRTPVVSELGLSVLTGASLEIAPDENGSPGEWGVQLDLSTVLEDLSPLKPVTYSQTADKFYTMNYGLDGRADGTTIALTDEANANVKSNGNASGTEDGYYIATTYWFRMPTNATVCLSEAKEVEEGTAGTGTYVVGNPVWNGSAVTHENGGNGLETALRVGFRCQTTDTEGNPIGTARFVIYEPNGDTHVDGTTGYVDTSSMDGGTTLVSSDNLIWQTTSTWNETTPTLSTDVVYTLGEFQTSTELFEISKETLVKVTMYVWLEGRDEDCTNVASVHETSILANIQFTSENEDIDTGIERDTDIDEIDGEIPYATEEETEEE